MSYASQQDITDLYGAELLDLISDLDGDGSADPDVVAKGLNNASALIDTHISARFELPLSSVPEVLVSLCVDIAVYQIAATADRGTDEYRQRYEDAISLLKRIADGKAGLGIASPSAPEANSQTVLTSGPGRVFSRDSLKGM